MCRIPSFSDDPEFNCEFGCMPMDHGEEPKGAWQCGNGHMFRYEPPPESPPWCSKIDCRSMNFIWIIKNDITGRDWLPDQHGEEPTLPMPIRRIITPGGGFMEITPTPAYIREVPELDPDEQLEAALRYIQNKYAGGIYDKMIRRETGGSDPLVQEPKQ